MATANEAEGSISPTSKSTPRSRRVGLLSPPLGFDSFNAAYESFPHTRPEASPPLPARSPLRPPTRTIIAPEPAMPTVDSTPFQDSTDQMPFHFQNPSFTSLTVLLDSLTNSHNDPSPAPRSPAPLPPSIMDDDHDEADSSANSVPTSTAPPISKRIHALVELLSSERAYASDLV